MRVRGVWGAEGACEAPQWQLLIGSFLTWTSFGVCAEGLAESYRQNKLHDDYFEETAMPSLRMKYLLSDG